MACSREYFTAAVYNAKPACRMRHAKLSYVTRSLFSKLYISVCISSSARRYSPGWVLASLTLSLHWSLFLALSVQPLIPIFLRSSVTSSVHLNLGLPILLFAYSFPFSTLLGMAISSILSTWPSHCILCAFINLTMSSPPTNLHNSLTIVSYSCVYVCISSKTAQ